MKSTRESSQQGIQTCHLCGKVQCGQRLGRVKCCLCSRIFCLQQLQRKFGISAVANDSSFKCPRCTGICCCMCNCQKPPPHVHCKVYKVRQNKSKPVDLIATDEHVTSQSPSNVSNSTSDKIQYPQAKRQEMSRTISDVSPLPPDNSIPVNQRMSDLSHHTIPSESVNVPRIPSLTMMDSYSGIYHEDCAKTNFESSRWDFYQPSWQETQGVWQYNVNDVPGIQNNDWLTQLNLTALDNVQQTCNMPSALTEPPNEDLSYASNQSFLDMLNMYFEAYGDPTDYSRCSLILELASQIHQRAGKCEILFKMLDSFNNNSIHVTVTWRLMHNRYDNCINGSVFPGLYTILKYYPTILFTLGSKTEYSDNAESQPNGKITITFLNTSSVMDIKPLCTSVALMDNCFRRFAEVSVDEKWSNPNFTWTAIGNTDQKKLKEMILSGEEAERILSSAKYPCRICVSMNLQTEDNYFEKLPLLSLILKRVLKEYPSVVFTLYRMSCRGQQVNCVVEFSEKRNWVCIINSYESNLAVWEYKEDDVSYNPSLSCVKLDI